MFVCMAVCLEVSVAMCGFAVLRLNRPAEEMRHVCVCIMTHILSCHHIFSTCNHPLTLLLPSPICSVFDLI